MKQCRTCKASKSLECFYKDRHSKDGHCAECHDCRSAYQKKWRAEQPERRAKADKLSWMRYKDIYQKNYKRWAAENREWRKTYRNALHARRRSTDPQYKWAHKIRQKVYLSLRGIRKSAPTEQLIGCSFQQLRRYLEMLWEPWMSWETYGTGPNTWQIDHVLPVSSFDLTDTDHQKLCWHYTNLRPLASEQNVAKRDKILTVIGQ